MIYGIAPHEILDWPEWVVSSLKEYLSKEPDPISRLEYMVAQGVSNYVNANREKGKPPYKLEQFMLFKDAWKNDEEVSEKDNLSEFLKVMGAVPKSKK